MTYKKKCNFTCLIYPLENELHARSLELISTQFEYIAIHHDKDIQDDGTFKKNHCHVIIKSKVPITIENLSKKIQLEPNYIEFVINYSDMLEYLIHANNIDKFQYSINDLFGSPSLLRKAKNKLRNATVDEYDDLELLISFALEKAASLTDISLYAHENNLWSTFRRNYYILRDLFIDNKQKYRRFNNG